MTRITRTRLNTLTAYINTHVFKNGRKLIVVSADSRVGGYNIRQTNGDLGSAQSDVFHGSAKECYAYLSKQCLTFVS